MLVKVHYSTPLQKQALKLPTIHSVQLSQTQVSLTFQIIVQRYQLKCLVLNAFFLLLCDSQIAGLVEGASKGEGLGNKFLSHIRQVDAIAQVIRCFDDPNITHVSGSIDPIRDIEIINTELCLADLESVEKRKQRIEKIAKSGDKDARASYHYQNASSKVQVKQNQFVHKVSKKKNQK